MIDAIQDSKDQRDSLTRTLPLETLEGFIGSKGLAFTLSRMETYRGPRRLAPNKDDSLSKTSMRFVNTIVLGLYTRSLWEKISEKGNMRAGKGRYLYEERSKKGKR